LIEVLVADDQQLIAQSLKIVLESRENLTVIGTASNGEEVLEILKSHHPDVILMDIRMPLMDGVECTRIVKEKYPNVKIIILTTFDDDDYVFNALKYGASGYLLKGVDMEQLCKAIETVSSGQAMINPDIASTVVRLFSQMAKSKSSITVNETNVKTLTQGEWRVVEEIKTGASNREIADALCLSEGTVRNHLTNILDKLGLRDRTQLAIWAVQRSIMEK
jgi:DNA-binding NarL/FixJ family response regulator